MKTKQINKVKVKVFEKGELRKNLGLNLEQINMVLTYQEKFPELLQKHKNDDFVINARNLWSSLNKPQGNFGDFTRRNIVESVFKEKGKNTKERKYKRDVDYTSYTQPCEKPQGGRPSIGYKLTVNCAKKIAMQQGNKIGDMIQDYFILVEEILRNYENWGTVRKDEKDGWNKMEQHIKNWCIRKEFDYTIRIFYTREENAINQALLGYDASEINSLLNNDDRITRNHLTTSINSAIEEVQDFNCNLLLTDMSFDQRKEMINTFCKNKYLELKNEFSKIINYI